MWDSITGPRESYMGQYNGTMGELCGTVWDSYGTRPWESYVGQYNETMGELCGPEYRTVVCSVTNLL